MDSAKHKHTCLRCGHIWDGRKVGAPIYCPQCNSKRVVPELMDTLKEKIAQAIYDKWNFSKPKGRLEVAEVIIALLPPMLTKDEARHVDREAGCDGCSAEDSLVLCVKIRESAETKLKAIQEGE